MARVGIHVNGEQKLRAVQAVLGRLPDALMDELARSLEMSVANIIEPPAKEKAPFDTGELSRSIQTTSARQGSGLRVTIKTQGLANAYAEPQHERKDYMHDDGKMDHFLYGEPYSAYEENLEELRAEVDGLLGAAAEEALRV